MADDIQRSLLIVYGSGKALVREIGYADDVFFQDVRQKHDERFRIVQEHPLKRPVVRQVRVS